LGKSNFGRMSFERLWLYIDSTPLALGPPRILRFGMLSFWSFCLKPPWVLDITFYISTDWEVLLIVVYMPTEFFPLARLLFKTWRDSVDWTPFPSKKCYIVEASSLTYLLRWFCVDWGSNCLEFDGKCDFFSGITFLNLLGEDLSRVKLNYVLWGIWGIIPFLAVNLKLESICLCVGVEWSGVAPDASVWSWEDGTLRGIYGFFGGIWLNPFNYLSTISRSSLSIAPTFNNGLEREVYGYF